MLFIGVMIAIFSKEDYDLTTDQVMDWLWFYKADFLRINGEDIYDKKNKVSYSINSSGYNFKLKKHDKQIDFNKIKVIWYRRWIPYSKIKNKVLSLNFNKKLSAAIKDNLQRELAIFSTAYFQYLEKKQWVDHPYNVSFVEKKIELLKLAIKYGLNTPDTIITNDIEDVKRFLVKHERIITKPISEVQFFSVHKKAFPIRTFEVTLDDLKQVKHLHVSLFQELIDKRYEIRTFYLGGAFYSMAIFSQRDRQTQVDFRNYNYQRPNRNVPYKLPKSIENILKKIFDKIQLKHGSVDFIRAKNGDYVFLEINPVGQFGMVSYPCNYNLEEKMALYLINQQCNDGEDH